jgi:2-hydroxy-6-oxo-6-(2'-carboxyphenyl)-hexa-2,4-dienoate hydrolase
VPPHSIVTEYRDYDRFVKDRLDSQRLRVVDADGTATRVYEAGDGPPLLLVHGGDFGSLYSLDGWSLNLERFAQRFQVVAFDKLGQGHTANPESDEAYSYERLVRHALAVAEAVLPGPAHIVGHSMGALLAESIALARPDLVRSLVLVDSNTAAPDDDRYPRGAFYRELERRLGGSPPTRETVRLEPELQSFSAAHVTDDLVGRLLAIATGPAYANAHACMERLRHSQWFPSLDAERERVLATTAARGLPVPALVVWGARDPSAPLPLAHALLGHLAQSTRDCELHVLADAGHYSFREAPRAFERAVGAFCLER